MRGARGLPYCPAMRLGLLALLMLATVHSAAAALTPLDSLLRATRADSLVEPLRRFESLNAHTRAGTDAALALGRLHYARGEYRLAAEAFGRAAARVDPAEK